MRLVEVSEQEKQAYEAGFKSGVAGECPNTVAPNFDDVALSSAWTKGWFDGDRSTDQEMIDFIGAEIRAETGKTAKKRLSLVDAGSGREK